MIYEHNCIIQNFRLALCSILHLQFRFGRYLQFIKANSIQ